MKATVCIRTVCILVLYSFFPPDLPASENKSPESIYRELLPSVMTLEVTTRGGESLVGTGFIAVDMTLVITAWHLIENAETVHATFHDGEKIELEGVIDWDVRKDIAFVRIGNSERLPCPMNESAPLIGSRAYVMGAPRGFEFSIVDGLISQTPVVDGFRQYQTSCPISPGNSGGPLINGNGEVTGIICWSKIDGQNLNFATPIESISLLNPSRPMTPWDDLRRAKRSSKKHAAFVLENSSLDDRRPTDDLPGLLELLEEYRGCEITISVIRNSREDVFQFKVPRNKKLTMKE